ncbi:type II toxin-antitoxin system YoeB family toxin [uncultured Helicobacter sp.]
MANLALKGDLKGLYSRRINDKHRLIYYTEGENLYIIACKTHYKDK